MQFARILEDAEYGQVLLLAETDNGGQARATIRFLYRGVIATIESDPSHSTQDLESASDMLRSMPRIQVLAIVAAAKRELETSPEARFRMGVSDTPAAAH